MMAGMRNGCSQSASISLLWCSASYRVFLRPKPTTYVCKKWLPLLLKIACAITFICKYVTVSLAKPITKFPHKHMYKCQSTFHNRKQIKELKWQLVGLSACRLDIHLKIHISANQEIASANIGWWLQHFAGRSSPRQKVGCTWDLAFQRPCE